MSRPEITISERQIVVVTQTYRLHLEFPAYVDPAAVALWGEGFEAAKKTRGDLDKLENEIDRVLVDDPPGIVDESRIIRMYKPKTCETCGKQYTPHGAAQRFCSDKCKITPVRRKKA